MFFHNIMHYSARLTVAQHGFESVSVQMAEEYSHYQELLARYGVRISRQLVTDELDEIRAAEYEPAVISQVLERRGVRTGVSIAPRSGKPLRRLRATLADLEHTLEGLSEDEPLGRDADLGGL